MTAKTITFPGGRKLKHRPGHDIDLPESFQVGIIPFRRHKKSLSVLMITSHTRNRWVFPKGNVKRGEGAREAGAREGFEEAGVIGQIIDRYPLGGAIGKSTDRGVREVPVVYYPFLVRDLAKKWPEADERERRWFDLEKAMKAAEHDDIIDVIENFGALGDRLFSSKALAVGD